MRKIVGYVDGKAVWTDNVPSEASIKAISGSLVVGESGPMEHARVHKRAKDAARKAAA